MSAAMLAAHLEAHGLSIRLWKDKRVYVYGYGRDVTCYIEPAAKAGISADGAFIVVSSTWRSPLVAMRCKGVKHALLRDLHAVGVLSAPPPLDWKQVRLDDRPAMTAVSKQV